ncbi:glycosyltransferase [Amycolatopsis speibonae]|uniref:Glycosyltransferase n=1 Tax=Amycolatopsis speibonae TaxID=1450224 RepID=A0ABV7PCZ3_9PSEU
MTGAPSHAREMLPAAGALARAGHEVLVVCVPQLVEEFTSVGLKAVAGLPDQTESWSEITDTGHEQVIKVVAGRTLIARGYPELLGIAAGYRPDLVLRDGMELCGCLVAERLGIPHVATPSGAVNTLAPAAIAPVLNERRAELGLDVQDDPLAIYRYGRIDSLPPRYSFAAPGIPPAVAYRQPETADRFTPLPAWIAELDPGKPLVYGAIGIALPTAASLRDKGMASTIPADPVSALVSMVDALSELDCVAVVSTGGVPFPRTDTPPHVRLVDHVPQPLLLQTVQLFVTHGGYNSVREAIRAGVPMVVAPLFGDQLDNARKVAELGLGEQVGDASDMAGVCRKVLDSAEIGARSRHAQRELLALPHVDEVAERLASVAASKTSLWS